MIGQPILGLVALSVQLGGQHGRHGWHDQRHGGMDYMGYMTCMTCMVPLIFGITSSDVRMASFTTDFSLARAATVRQNISSSGRST